MTDWLASCGEEFYHVVKGLEHQGHELESSLLKVMRGLLTDQTRRTLLQHMKEQQVNIPALVDKAVDLQRMMWAEWHFKQAPPELIHQTRRMFLAPLPSRGSVWASKQRNAHLVGTTLSLQDTRSSTPALAQVPNLYQCHTLPPACR